MRIETIIDARKEAIKADDAWKIIKKASTVQVGRGKKSVVYIPGAESKEEILKVSLGRTGNLRAPAICIGEKMYIGYNDAAYREILG